MWDLIAIQWLHVLLSIFWFGSVLYLNFVVIPAVTGLPLDEQRAVSKRIATQSNRVILPVATLAILTGILRGTIWGPVRSLDILFGTAYGMTFLAAFMLAIATYAWGYFFLGREAERLNEIPVDAKFQERFAAALQRVKIMALVELVGFFSIFTCMILMRFGL